MALETPSFSTNIVPKVAFRLLNDAELIYQENQRLSPEILQALHAVFGTVLVRATELLESGYFKQYQTSNGVRKVLKVGTRSEDYTLFPDINFCHCPAFKYQVLHARKTITCKHVLAAKLAQITRVITVESVTDEQLRDILNDQCDLRLVDASERH